MKKLPVKKPKAAPAKPKDKPLDIPPLPVTPFNLENALRNRHDLGPIHSPETMLAKATGNDHLEVSRLAENVLDDLLASGAKDKSRHAVTGYVIGEALRRLRDFALSGDERAMEAYGHAIFSAVADLNEMARQKPETVRAWSRKMNVVPVLTGRNAGHRRRLIEDLDAFAVGEASPYRVNPPPGKKAPDFSKSANQLAAHLVQHIATHSFDAGLVAEPVPEWVRLAYEIGPLNTAIAERYIEAVWALLLDATQGHPERLPALAALGAKGARKDGLRGKRTVEANVRAEIKQALRKAVLMLAAQSS